MKTNPDYWIGWNSGSSYVRVSRLPTRESGMIPGISFVSLAMRHLLSQVTQLY